jgi:hypothetical protein
MDFVHMCIGQILEKCFLTQCCKYFVPEVKYNIYLTLKNRNQGVINSQVYPHIWHEAKHKKPIRTPWIGCWFGVGYVRIHAKVYCV